MIITRRPADVREPGDRACGGRAAPFLVHFVGGVEAQLEKFRIRIDELGDALAGGEAAFLVLRFDGLRAAALANFFLFVLDFGEALDHLAVVFLKRRGFGVEAAPFLGPFLDRVFDGAAQVRSAPCEAAATRWRMKSTMACVVVPGRKTSAMPAFFSAGMSASGMMPPISTVTSVMPFWRSKFHQARAQSVVRAGKDRKADDVDVFLQRGGGDHFRRLAQAGVDHFHAGVAQRARDHFGAAVVAVEAGLGDQHAYLFLWHVDTEY